MFKSNFTDELEVTVARAFQIALRSRHESIDLAHLLLAFIEAPTEAVDRVSKETDPAFELTRQRVLAFLDKLPKQRAKKLRVEDLRLSSRLKLIIEHARYEATRRGAKRISPEHLFLALAAEDFYSEAERGAVGDRLLSPVELTPFQIEQLLF